MSAGSGDALGARAGTSALVMFGGAFGYRALRDLTIRGIPGGPPGIPAEELPDEDFDDLEYEADTEEEPDFDEEAGAEGLPGAEADLDDFDPDQKYRATPKAADMLAVVYALKRWLANRPGAPSPSGRRLSSDP